MEIKIITTEKGEYTPKNINERMTHLSGKIQYILQNNYLLASLNIR
jgi:hypothetical protein